MMQKIQIFYRGPVMFVATCSFLCLATISLKVSVSNYFQVSIRRDLSQQVLLSNQVPLFIDQLDIYKYHCFSFFPWMLVDTQMRSVKEK